MLADAILMRDMSCSIHRGSAWISASNRRPYGPDIQEGFILILGLSNKEMNVEI